MNRPSKDALDVARPRSSAYDASFFALQVFPRRSQLQKAGGSMPPAHLTYQLVSVPALTTWCRID